MAATRILHWFGALVVCNITYAPERCNMSMDNRAQYKETTFTTMAHLYTHLHNVSVALAQRQMCCSHGMLLLLLLYVCTLMVSSSTTCTTLASICD